MCIDVLSKICAVVPVRRKETGSVIKGTTTAIEKMGKKPIIIYSDDEKAIASGEFQQFVEDKALNCIEPEVTQLLQRLLSGLLKVSFSKELRTMKKIRSLIYSGLIT